MRSIRDSQASLCDPKSLAQLDQEQLCIAIAPLFEPNPQLAGLLAGRNFDSWEELVSEAARQLLGADEESKAAILRSHPRLGEDPKELASRSYLSYLEQQAHLPSAKDSPLERARKELAQLNVAYESRFGFPFVEWVNGRPLAELADSARQRLTNERSSELDRGCRELLLIARDRLSKLARPSGIR